MSATRHVHFEPISSAVRLSESRSTPASQTEAPSSLNRNAAARPIPVPPPLIRQVFPARSMSGVPPSFTAVQPSHDHFPISFNGLLRIPFSRRCRTRRCGWGRKRGKEDAFLHQCTVWKLKKLYPRLFMATTQKQLPVRRGLRRPEFNPAYKGPRG